MEQAEAGRDMKREGAMCAFGLCTANPEHDAPDGWTGKYGGSTVCSKHFKKLCDEILETDGNPSWDQ